ncbi:MAG: hypothetical protein M0Z35_13175 [Desulfitobacterium hafniense]|nr:hypothetical protein [Desulfitobacterium hafniense]
MRRNPNNVAMFIVIATRSGFTPSFRAICNMIGVRMHLKTRNRQKFQFEKYGYSLSLILEEGSLLTILV